MFGWRSAFTALRNSALQDGLSALRNRSAIACFQNKPFSAATVLPAYLQLEHWNGPLQGSRDLHRTSQFVQSRSLFGLPEACTKKYQDRRLIK